MPHKVFFITQRLTKVIGVGKHRSSSEVAGRWVQIPPGENFQVLKISYKSLDKMGTSHGFYKVVQPRFLGIWYKQTSGNKRKITTTDTFSQLNESIKRVN